MFGIDDMLPEDLRKKVVRHIVAYGGTVENVDSCSWIVTERKNVFDGKAARVVAPNFIFQCHAKQKLL